MAGLAAGCKAWDDVSIERVAQMMRDGMSGTEIGTFFGVSRSSIHGLVRRTPALQEVGFKRIPGAHSLEPKGSTGKTGEKKRRWTSAEIEKISEMMLEGVCNHDIAQEMQTTRIAISKLISRTKRLHDIIAAAAQKRQELRGKDTKLHREKHKTARGAATPNNAPIYLVSNNVEALVNDWLSRNGGARRFERGASSDFDNVRRYLRERGYEIGGSPHGNQNRYTITNGRGRPRKVRWQDILAIADEYRVKEGREPFVARNAA